MNYRYSQHALWAICFWFRPFLYVRMGHLAHQVLMERVEAQVQMDHPVRQDRGEHLEQEEHLEPAEHPVTLVCLVTHHNQDPFTHDGVKLHVMVMLFYYIEASGMKFINIKYAEVTTRKHFTHFELLSYHFSYFGSSPLWYNTNMIWN